MNNSMKLFAPHLTMFGVEDKFNTRINTNYIAQYWAVNAKQHKQKPTGTGYKRTLAKFSHTKPTIGGDLPSVPLNPIQNLVNSQLQGGEYQLQLPTMNRRDKRSMFLYNQHLQGGDYQQPTHWNDKGFTIHQGTGNPYTTWQKRNSGDAANKDSQSPNKDLQSHLKLTGQTPKALVGHETNQKFSYGTGSFPSITPRFQNKNRLQNTLNNNRNRYFQHQYWDDQLSLPHNQSNRSVSTAHGHFHGIPQQGSQPFDPTRFFMVGNKKVPPSYRRQSYGSGKFPYEGMLPTISQEGEGEEDGLDEGYRYKYNSRDSGDQNTSELMGKYAKYYHTQEHSARGMKSSMGLRSVPSPVEEPNDKNNELLSRYLKHSAKKQVRAGSVHVPKYTGDYDPNVFSTKKVSSNEKVPPIPHSTSKPLLQEEEKDSPFNKKEAAAEQKFRLEKATFPTSLSSKKKDADKDNPQEKGKYQLTYTKRKKMVVASTSDRENDPSMLVKGGDDVTTTTTDDYMEPSQSEVADTPEPTQIASRSGPSTMTPVPKKPLKKIKKPSTMPKLLPKIEANKEVDKTPKNRRKGLKPVDVKRDSKKVEAQQGATVADVEATKVEQNHQDEETADEDLKLQSLNEKDWLHLEEQINDDEKKEGQQDATDDNKDKEGKKTEEEEDPLEGLVPPRAKVPDYLKMSSMSGFLPITPVTFSWFPMSQQHREEFKRMSEQSKVPPSMRPFQNKKT